MLLATESVKLRFHSKIWWIPLIVVSCLMWYATPHSNTTFQSFIFQNFCYFSRLKTVFFLEICYGFYRGYFYVRAHLQAPYSKNSNHNNKRIEIKKKCIQFSMVYLQIVSIIISHSHNQFLIKCQIDSRNIQNEINEENSG